jgi:tRNA-specific 2-thiouridylase
LPHSVFVKIRSTRPPVEASLRYDGEKTVVTVLGGEYGVSPGQASVFYDGPGTGARVLGGGFIAAVAS